MHSQNNALSIFIINRLVLSHHARGNVENLPSQLEIRSATSGPRSPDGKSTRDSEKCAIRELLRELEDTGFTDPSINCHDIVAPLAAEVGEGLGSTNQLTQESRNQCLVPVVILHVEVVSSPT